MRLAQSSNKRKSTSSNGSEKAPKISLKTIMHKFDPERSDIKLFLNLFERRAERVEIEQHDLVTHLLTLLSIEIAELVLCKLKEKADDFAHVKSVLLARYRLSPEAYRQKLNKHTKSPNASWKYLIFGLNTFQEEWLTGLNITMMEELKDLLITEQIKRRVANEIKEHFIDFWAEYKNAETFVKDLDGYDTINGVWKKITELEKSSR